MYSRFQSALKFIKYYNKASNSRGHGIHSPFVFQFITKILNDKTKYADYKKVESLRKTLLSDPTILSIKDLGAGSAANNTKERSISSIASHSVKPGKFGQLLFRMVKQYQPQTILELGTSLGVTTSYLSLANPTANVITLEGSDAIAGQAKKNFDSLNLKNIRLVVGDFNDTLEPLLATLPSIDFAFIDGNHRKEPTIKYFTSILSHSHSSSVLILDDIHWSAEMEEAWEYCRKHTEVRLSIDLFFMGALFFRNEILEKQHFSIRF